MSSNVFSLDQLGWRATFSSQLRLEELERGVVARVSAVHRGRIEALAEAGCVDVPLSGAESSGRETARPTVGDWIVVDASSGRLLRVLGRQSVITRLAAGERHEVQAIAANVDTAFVVTSCNADFNPSRLERYLAVVLEAGVTPVIVLTKADLSTDPQAYVEQAARVAAGAAVVALDATRDDVGLALGDWLQPGQVVVFIGSSGVGKSTLINALLGETAQATASIREDDARGRHTTTSRQLHGMAGGAWLIDVPGMRELQIGTATAGISQAFTDLEALARGCRFRDCRHEDDAGCALRAAVEGGRVEPRRLKSFLKLGREAARAAQAEHERRAATRRTGRIHAQASRQRRRERWDG